MPDLYQELNSLANSDMYPFHMPGHKRNLESTPMKGAFRCDITEIDDFDNLHDESGILLDAELRANSLYGSDQTYYLVNGSTCGVLAAVSGAVHDGGTVLAARGSHRSFYHAAYLNHLNIRYLPYKVDSNYGIPESYSADEIKEYLTKDIDCVFITSPTYEGKCSEVKKIAELCHESDIPLIVDAAHGANFGFEGSGKCNGYEYDRFPESAACSGADLVIHSLHKTLPSMTQTALLHVNGNLVDRDILKRYLRIYQSSSPSYVLMASMDLCMQEMQEKGKEFVDKLLEYRNRIQIATSNCKCLEIPGKSAIDDAAKVLIYVKNGTMTGPELYDILREEYNLQLEMAGDKYALAILSGWDTDDGIDRLISAILDIDAKMADSITDQSLVDKKDDDLLHRSKSIDCELPETIMNINDAWNSEVEKVSIDEAAGRIAGEFVNLYPPGIPIIVPGERFTDRIIEDIRHYLDNDMNVQGMIDRKEFLCVKQR